ncbi:S-layer homology domain-containing protein [Paenibacillus hamazuiensis]|uniref:S-layer homology domain-containing protein n=1 Tax=Paenibacillus hamazuiensis TaxID=2936508 RepID=UPI00200BCA92|nr:S-layer homology domain-containing protein [Paenibacillus hamazuiensis]
MLFKARRRMISQLLVLALLLSALMPSMAFGATVQLKDLADSYAKTEIQSLVEAGIISGYEDNTFQPRKAMTRAELAKIIVLSMGLKESADKAAAFKDVDAKSWYRGYVGALVDSGITEGTSNTTFSPDAKVTREELVVFFIRAFGLEETAKKLKADAKLTDLDEVSDWARAHVSLAFKIGFVNGIDNADGTLKFSPKDSAERQALARLAYEFKTNKAKYVDKAKEIEKEEATTTPETTPGTGGGSGGSGGNGSSSSGGSKDKSNTSKINMINNGSTVEGDVILPAGTYGPATGTARVKGTLTLNPGETGTITLNNIEADNIVVASGAPDSIHLKGVIVKVKLTISAGGQNAVVRVVAEGGSSIAATDVLSQAIVEALGGGNVFGTITLNPSSSNKTVTFKGTITSTINVAGTVTMNVYEGASLSDVQLTSDKADVSIEGSGSIENVTPKVTGAKLNINDKAASVIKKVTFVVGVKVNLGDNANAIGKINIVVPEGSKLEDLLTNVVDSVVAAIKAATVGITYESGDSASSVTKDLKLGKLDGATVIWSSDNPLVVSDSGKVTRQPKDVKVTLTAKISIPLTNGVYNVTKTFTVVVKGYGTSETPVSAKPVAEDVFLVNYVEGGDDVYVDSELQEGTIVKVYGPDGNELGSAKKQDDSYTIYAWIKEGFPASASKIYVTITEVGKLESEKLELDIPVRPADLDPKSIVPERKQNGDLQLTFKGLGNANERWVGVYTAKDGNIFAPLTGANGTDQIYNVPNYSLNGALDVYVSYFQRSGTGSAESYRVKVAVPSVPSVTVTDLVYSQPGTVSGPNYQLNLKAVLSNGDLIDVTNSATWTSLDTSIATVSNTGLVTKVAPGTAVITAKYGKLTASYTITFASITPDTVNAGDYKAYTQDSVSGSVYGPLGTNNSGNFVINASNDDTTLIITFDNGIDLKYSQPHVTVNNGTVTSSVYASVYDSVYNLKIEDAIPTVSGSVYTVSISGLQRMVDGVLKNVDTVTFTVYKD